MERQHQHGALRAVGLRNPVQRPLVASGAGTFRNQRDDHVRAHDHVVLVDCTWTMDGGNVAEGHSLSGMVADLHCSSEHGGTTCDDRQMTRRGRRTLDSPCSTRLHVIHDNIQRSRLPGKVTALDAFEVRVLLVNGPC